MNRSRKAIITTLGVAGLCLIAWNAYRFYYGPRIYRLDTVDAERDIWLESRPGRGHVYAIELEFEGELSGDAIIYIGSGDEPFYAKTRLKAGRVRADFTSDWYYDQLLLHYEPEGKIEGKLSIRYQFIQN